MNEFIGIDFGTTHCRTGIYRSGNFEALRNYYDLLEINPSIGQDEYFRKRNITIPAFLGLKQLIGYDQISSDDKKKVSGLVEELFSKIFINVRENLHSDIINGVLTVPCYYHDRERSALISLAERAGFNQVRLLDENIAHALGLDLKPESKNILVYSLGAGFFSCTLLIHEGKNYRSLNSGFDNTLSGTFFDSVIMKKIFESLSLHPRGLRSQEQIYLIGIANKAKMELNELLQSTIPMHIKRRRDSSVEPNPEIKNITISRREFEESCTDFINETIQLCIARINDSGLQKDDIDLVLLAGGSTHIPVVRQMIHEAFKKEIVLSDNYAICRGAALFASTLPEPEIKVKKPPEPVQEQKREVVTQEMPQKPKTSTNDWSNLFSKDFDDSHSIWQEGDYIKSISNMESLQGKINTFIADLCRSAGNKYMDKGFCKEALTIFTRGYAYDKNNSYLINDLLGCYEVLIEEALKSNDFITTMNYLKEGLSYNSNYKDWQKKLAYLRNNIKKIKHSRGFRN